MKKIFLLARMLNRGSGEDDKEKNQNADVFNLFMIIVLAAAALAIGIFLTPISQTLIPNTTVATLLSVIAAMVSLVRIIPMIINGLFMSKDVEVLLTLPYTPLQLALSNSINIVQTVFLYQVAATFPLALGCIIAETSSVVELLIMDVLFIVFVPIFVSFALIFLATLIMKTLKTMANKEFQKIIGVVIGAIALIAITIISFNTRTTTDPGQIESIISGVSNFTGLAYIIPVAPLIQDLVCQGNILNILWIILIDGALTALTFITLNKFYLSILKQVTNTFGGHKKVSDQSISDSIKSNGIIKAIVLKDVKLILRDSAYYLNGIISPLILGIFFLFIFTQFITKFAEATAMAGQSSALLISLYSGLSMGLMAACGFVGMSGIAACSLSREGQSYIFIKQLPLHYKKQIKAKRIVAILFTLPIAALAIIVFSIMGMASGSLSWITPVVGLITLIPMAIFFCNWAMIIDIKKPNLFITNLNKITSPKTAVSIVSIIVDLIALMLPLMFIFVPILSAATGIDTEILTNLAFALAPVLIIIFFILAWITTKNLNTKGVERLAAL